MAWREPFLWKRCWHCEKEFKLCQNIMGENDYTIRCAAAKGVWLTSGKKHNLYCPRANQEHDKTRTAKAFWENHALLCRPNVRNFQGCECMQDQTL